jgi:chorismate dehydratase
MVTTGIRGVNDDDPRITNAAPPRLAASSYLNTAPLIWSFQHGSRAGTVELVTDRAPARSAQLLARGEVDAALVPVIEYARIPGVEIVPGVCVGARRRVESVVLATDGRDLKDVRAVKLDSASRTSAALTEIIFREFLGRDVPLTSADFAAGEEATADACLVIGDPAMRLDQARWRVFDLAEAWHRFTGYGFVFAMWMRNPRRRHLIERVDFARARDEGLANTDDIIRLYRGDVPRSDGELKTYLHEHISYAPDDSMHEGMRLFFRLAYKYGLIPRVPATELAAGI